MPSESKKLNWQEGQGQDNDPRTPSSETPTETTRKVFAFRAVCLVCMEGGPWAACGDCGERTAFAKFAERDNVMD